MRAIHPRDYGAALIDEKWSYTPEETKRITAALGVDAEKQDTAMVEVLLASRRYRAYSVVQEKKPLHSDVKKQLEDVQKASWALHELLSPKNYDLYVALQQRPPIVEEISGEGKIAKVSSRAGWSASAQIRYTLCGGALAGSRG